MTTTTTATATPRKPPERWDRTITPVPIGYDSKRFPPTGVIGEIKPHNSRGIRAGILQLRRRHRERPSKDTSFRLLTYRQIGADPTKYEVLVADPIQLGTIVRSRSGEGRPATWYAVGPVTMTDATRLVPLWTCPTMLGNRLEPKVRARYQGWMRREQKHPTLQLGVKDASATGPDFTHELADFLRELATELELEAEAALGSSAEAGW